MTSSYNSVRLGDVCTKIGSGATPRGGSEVYRESGPASLIRSQNVHNNRFLFDGLAYLDKRHADELANVLVEEGDVLLNITGDSVARCTQAPRDALPARVNQHVAIIRPNRSQLNPSYLRYLLVSPLMQNRMLALAGAGATRNALTKGMIEDFQIPCPDLSTQDRIADILGSLDAKIELNRRMNETLESMARRLFKSWFIDFDPIHAKASVRRQHPTWSNERISREALPKLDPKLAELFPDGFEESPLGNVPKGWKVEPLDAIATFLNGLALQKYPETKGTPSLPVIKIAQLRVGSSESADRCNTNVPEAYIVNDGDILFSWSGSLLVRYWCGGKGALNQHLFKVTSIRFPPWFCYAWLCEHLPGFQAIAAGKATTMGHIQRHHLTGALTVTAPTQIIQAADTLIGPLAKLRIRNEVTCSTLAQTRDKLLPRLLSREVNL